MSFEQRTAAPLDEQGRDHHHRRRQRYEARAKPDPQAVASSGVPTKR
jgi:hypothetical protein